jgi:hypothetical protein
MARKSQLTQVEIAERLTALERDYHHRDKAFESLVHKVEGISQLLSKVVYYVKISVTVGVSLVLHVSGKVSADVALGWLHLLKDLFA